VHLCFEDGLVEAWQESGEHLPFDTCTDIRSELSSPFSVCLVQSWMSGLCIFYSFFWKAGLYHIMRKSGISQPFMYGTATRFPCNVHWFRNKKKTSNRKIFTGIIFSAKIEFMEYQLFSYWKKFNFTQNIQYSAETPYLAFIQDFQECLGSHLLKSWQAGFQAPQRASDMLQNDLKGIPSQLCLN